MEIVILIVLILCAFYVFAVKGRTGHKKLPELRGWSYAHRGLHGDGVPENSMQAFRMALESGYGIELDIHLLADGNLAVIHDSALKRTTGAEGNVEDLTTPQLKDYRLEGTEETIPEFRQVLELFAGKAPLIIELKAERNNYAQLCEAACNMMDGYEGLFCMESFDPRCVAWLKNNRPEIIRGQLTANFLAGKSKMPWILKFVMTHQLCNLLGRPDFTAYSFPDRKNISNAVCRGLWGVQGVTWTLKTKEDYDTAVNEGWLPIFEGFRP